MPYRRHDFSSPPGADALAEAATPTDALRAFYSLGLAHILSISGFHLGVFAGVVLLGFEVSYTLSSSFRDETTNADRTVPALLAWNSTIGLDF